jgi:hypothetical protein
MVNMTGRLRYARRPVNAIVGDCRALGCRHVNWQAGHPMRTTA